MGGGVTVPGGVQEKGRCHIEGCGLVANIGGMWMVGQGTLEIFSNLNDYMSL